MKQLRNILRALAAGAGLFLCTHVAYAADVVLRGDEKCMTCHQGVKTDKILPIALSRHAVKADGRTPSCTNCHGPSDQHMNSGGGDKPDRLFIGSAKAPADSINGACLTCHESGARNHWPGSKHQTEGLACTNCHGIHTANDKVLTKATQPEVCFNCHKTERAQTHRISTHPIAAGKMACSDCHAPHGSTGPKLLVKNSVNETCYTCHAEKRGPFLWEHSPVFDDCTNCHTPHGSTNTPLLKARVPWLCQECHSGDHGAAINSGANLVTGNATTVNNLQPLASQSPRAQTNACACLNCHVMVHGSNHPAGAKYQR